MSNYINLPLSGLEEPLSEMEQFVQDTAHRLAEAVQIFGGNGLTKEYPVEKLMRDARAMLIADGCNEVLALKGGSLLINPELL